jgi:ParB family transcriptional regulator, chromosome partitioning protein
MARKNLLAGLSERKPATGFDDEGGAARLSRTPPLAYAARGAFGAVTRTIDDLAARADAAKDLEGRVAAGDLVVEIDPKMVDGAFIADRMGGDDEGYLALLEGMRAQGQASPILVRPHPHMGGRYQVAFGHRRLRAALELGRPVRAVVKQLSDRDLVLAQGQENSARADLSFIERSRFAWQLESANYDRDTIMSALSVDKTTASRMISVASQLPDTLINAIGPAPGTGRDRWLDLCALFQSSSKDRALDQLLQDPAFIAASSDSRFDAVQQFLRHPTDQHESEQKALLTGGRPSSGQKMYWSSSNGVKVAKITTSGRNFILTIDRRVAPDFGDYLLGQMERLYKAYSALRTDGA